MAVADHRVRASYHFSLKEYHDMQQREDAKFELDSRIFDRTPPRADDPGKKSDRLARWQLT